MERMDSASWESLVTRALAERTAFAALHDAAAAAVRRMLRQRMDHDADLDDVLQRTWLRASTALPALRERGRFLPWLLAIAHREFLQWERARRLAPRPMDMEAIMHSCSAAASPAADAAGELAGRIARLDGDDRQILELRFEQGLSAREIADIVGMPHATVRSRLHRALGQLRASLRGDNSSRRRS